MAASLLLLIPSRSYRARDFLAAAAAIGAGVIVGSDHRQVLAAFDGGRSLYVDLADTRRGAAQIVAHASRAPLAAVLGTDDESALLAAVVGKALGLAHNPPEAVAAARDKYRFREVLAAAGVAGPGHRLVDLHASAAAQAAGVRYPCVLKPRSLSASRGVIRADDASGFIAASARIAAILDCVEHLDEPSHRHTVLVEDYVPGAEVALEGLLDGGQLHVLALMDKPDPMPGPVFEETLLITPSRLPDAEQRVVAAEVATAAAALGLRHGPVHAEARIGADGVRIIEIAPRSIGGLCSRMLRFESGDRLETLILRQALGLPVQVRPAAGAAGVMMIPVPGAGRLRAVDGLDAARAVPGIDGVEIGVAAGERLQPLPEGGRYPGFIFASAAHPAAVEAALRRAHGCLEFRLE